MSVYNYFANLYIDGYAFPTVPQSSFGFNAQAIMFLNRGVHTILYSFDGRTIHGDLRATDASRGLSFDGRLECKVWFAAEGGFGDLRVEAWR